MMKALKVEWNRGDTFDTMHKKMLALVGCQIVNKKEPSKPFKVFEVSDIHTFELQSIGIGFLKFLSGDKNYIAKDGGYNFEGIDSDMNWCFHVDYGFEMKDGGSIRWRYNCCVPKLKTYDEDKSQIVEHSDHPFVHYADNLWGK